MCCIFYMCLASDFFIDILGHVMVFNTLFLKICLFSYDFYFDNVLILWTLAVKWCTAIGARPDVCGVINVCLNSRWFSLSLVYISCLVLTLVSGDRD
jgi:hypothetical protein